jgi:hypothetical protein
MSVQLAHRTLKIIVAKRHWRGAPGSPSMGTGGLPGALFCYCTEEAVGRLSLQLSRSHRRFLVRRCACL